MVLDLYDKYFLKTVTLISLLFILLIFGTSSLCGQTIKPKLSITTSGAVTDFVVQDNKLYAATDQGIVDVIYLSDGSSIRQINMPPITDFMGDEVQAKIFSLDILDDKLLLVVQGNHGFRNVLLHHNGAIGQIIDADKDKLLIKKARFVDGNTMLFGLLSNELILFDVQLMKQIYRLQISAYSFSDFCFNDSRSEVIAADESGIVHRIRVSDGKILNEYSGNNVDNVYQTVLHNGVIITGGQDRRIGIYNTGTNEQYYIESDFLVYSVGLSPDGSIGAFSAGEENDVCLFDTNTKKVLKTLNGHQSTPTKIVFIDNFTIITSCDYPNVYVWEVGND